MEQEGHEPAMDAQNGVQGGLSHFDFNPDNYRHHLDGSNLTPEQQDELLHILHDIMRQFVDWGYNLHPVQAAQSDGKPCFDVVALVEHWAAGAEQEEAE